MICSRCGRYVPDEYLACPACVAEKSNAALRRYQYDFLRHCSQGRMGLNTRSLRGTRHVEMFGAEQTFCGEQTANLRKGRLNFRDLGLLDICEVCRKELMSCLDRPKEVAS